MRISVANNSCTLLQQRQSYNAAAGMVMYAASRDCMLNGLNTKTDIIKTNIIKISLLHHFSVSLWFQNSQKYQCVQKMLYAGSSYTGYKSCLHSISSLVHTKYKCSTQRDKINNFVFLTLLMQTTNNIH